MACQVGSVSLVGCGFGHIAWLVLEELSTVAPFLRRMWLGVNVELKRLQTTTLYREG